jgi:hypothetical protein
MSAVSSGMKLTRPIKVHPAKNMFFEVCFLDFSRRYVGRPSRLGLAERHPVLSFVDDFWLS